MQFDIDDAIARAEQQVLPWDFSLTVKGATYATRPLTLAELHALGEIAKKPEGEQRNMVRALFVNPDSVPVHEWTSDQVGACGVAVASYFAGRVKKKSQNLGRGVAHAMGVGDLFAERQESRNGQPASTPSPLPSNSNPPGS